MRNLGIETTKATLSSVKRVDDKKTKAAKQLIELGVVAIPISDYEYNEDHTWV